MEIKIIYWEVNKTKPNSHIIHHMTISEEEILELASFKAGDCILSHMEYKDFTIDKVIV